jgi:hypothetical protein
MATWITATEPSVVPSVAEKVFDKWRIEQFSTVGEGTQTPVQLHVIFVKARTYDETVTAEDGTTTTVTKTEVNPNIKTNLFVPDLYTLIGEDADVADAFSRVLAALDKIAKAKGVI